MEMEPRRLLVLSCLMVVYLCVGAAVFNALEASNEQARKEELENEINVFLNRADCVSREELHNLLFKASRDVELVYYILNNKTHLDRWDFSGAFGFSISVVTTIGFGNLAPHTMEGKVLVVVYALIGIPLMLLLLAAIGEKLAFVFKRMYKLNVCSTKPQVNRVLNMVLIILLGLLVGFIAPATLFHFIEQWHFLEAVYFCFTTLSTIGFGDYIIGIHEEKISEGVLHETYEVVAYVWILFGLAYVSLVIKYISDLLLSKAQKVEQKTVRRLEGTRLFRKFSDGSKQSAQGFGSKSSICDREDHSVSVSLPCQQDERPPPTYSTEIERMNGEIRRYGSTSALSVNLSSGRTDGEAVRVGNDNTGVELISVNYI